MLFNSPAFLSIFLPIAVFLYYRLGRHSSQAALIFLTLASFAFYSCWNPKDLLLILASLSFNYFLSWRISEARGTGRPLLATGVAFNLLLLGYFKYTKFLLGIFGEAPPWASAIVLPLAISFYTFQQISYLVHTYQEKKLGRQCAPPGIIKYTLFIVFFPHLIAGPIVRDSEFIHQIGPERTHFVPESVGYGLILFLIGLAKKLLFADLVAADVSDRVFGLAFEGKELLATHTLWGILAYTLQIYFDFSGYSDMAIGLAAMFGFKLPINFDSPYRAHSIEDFWRRWHITLSRFLRDYLYIPLGGNRRGGARRNLNLLITMLLGGLWHGANWTFVLWGGLHGVFLVARRYFPWTVPLWAGRALTFACVALAWVPFRAQTMDQVGLLLSSLAHWYPSGDGPLIHILWRYRAFLLLSLVVTQLPWNSQRIAGWIAGHAWGRAVLNPAASTLVSWRMPVAFGLASMGAFGVATMFYGYSADIELYRKDLLRSIRPLMFIEGTSGSFRQSFLNTTFVRHSQESPSDHQIAIVGSSFATEIADISFAIGPRNYTISSVANNGQEITHLFRQAGMAAHFRPHAIIVAFSPATIGSIENANAFNGFSDSECVDAFNRATPATQRPVNSFQTCGYEATSLFSFRFWLSHPNPLFQFRAFLNDSTFRGGGPVGPPLSLGSRKSLAEWQADFAKLERDLAGELDHSGRYQPETEMRDWQKNHSIRYLEPESEIYRAFASMKERLAEDGISLLLYATPLAITGRENIPHEYFSEYRRRMRQMTDSLRIPFLDLTDYLPNDRRWMSDFVHARPEARQGVLPKKIALFYLDACARGKLKCE